MYLFLRKLSTSKRTSNSSFVGESSFAHYDPALVYVLKELIHHPLSIRNILLESPDAVLQRYFPIFQKIQMSVFDSDSVY